VVAAALAAVAALIVAAGLRAPPPPTVGVLAAAHDLAGGAALRSGDVVTVRLPPSAVPDGALRDHAAGRRTSGPLRRGEPLTDARLLGPGLLAGYPQGTVAAPVRVADADVAALLQTGDHVDILAAGSASGGVTDDPAAAGAGAVARDEPVPDGAGVVARDVPVVAVVGGGAESAGREGVLVVVAVPGGVAGVLARDGVGARISVTIRSR
jgi:Flp pilus assembly protein CpaB